MSDSSGDLFVIIAGWTNFIGSCFLLCCGDASQLSLKMLRLWFVTHILSVPSPSSDLMDIILYVLFILIFLWIFYSFRTKGCCFHETYSRKMDSFPLYWLLPLVALAVPLLFYFLTEDGISHCTPQTHDEEMVWCTYYLVWATSHCLQPLTYLPQVLILYKLSKRNEKLETNVRIFLLMEMIAAIMIFLIAALGDIGDTSYFLWGEIVASPLTVLLVGHTWIFHCLCKRGQFKDDDGDHTFSSPENTAAAPEAPENVRGPNNTKILAKKSGWGNPFKRSNKNQDIELGPPGPATTAGATNPVKPGPVVASSNPEEENTSSNWSNPFKSSTHVEHAAPTIQQEPDWLQSPTSSNQQHPGQTTNDFSTNWLS